MRCTPTRLVAAAAARKLNVSAATTSTRRKLKFNELGQNFQSQPALAPLKSDRGKTGGRMLNYIVQVMNEHPNCVVLTQVGSFYEMYFEHAIEYGPKLNLRVARKRQQSPVPHLPFVNMAGFPAHHVERYVKILVHDLGKNVVLLEQVQSEVFGDGDEEAKRPISRLVTPGTLLAESFVDTTYNNYLVAVSLAPNSEDDVCLTWVDVAVGKIQYQLCNRQSLANNLARLAPAEILIDSTARSSIPEIMELLETNAPIVHHKFPPKESVINFAHRFGVNEGDSIRYKLDLLPPRAQKTCAALMSYIDESHPTTQMQFELPEKWYADDTMQLDSRSRDALEMFVTRQTGSARGGLLSVLRRTVSPSGSRLLQTWLTSPLQSISSIEWRQERVAHFVKNSCHEIIQSLKELPDGKRILQKLQLRKLDPLDLVGFAQSLQILDCLRASLAKYHSPLMDQWLEVLDRTVPNAMKTANKILRYIDTSKIIATEGVDANDSSDNKPSTSTSRSSFSNSRRSPYIPILYPNTTKRLRELYETRDSFDAKKEEIMDRLERTYVKNSLKLTWSPQHNYHVHLRIDSSEALDPSITVLSRHKKTACVVDKEWATIGAAHDQFNEDLQREEQRILQRLRDEIIENHVTTMREAYTVSDEVDVIVAFAELAKEKRLVRPQLVEESILDIKGGRHITVETGLELEAFSQGSQFTANDCMIDPHQPVCMISGPNMGGKSTYIRQGALITLLAHIGSFVPASSATIGLVDRIFCRIGAGDDLYRGRSTFMMEMLETAQILDEATSRSLAILDEVGRGTSTKDGLALATATIKHLSTRTGCRTLFATHFAQEIWDALKCYSTNCTNSIKCLQATVEENDGEVNFNYVLQPGISSNSHGLLIAKMARFPKPALQDAQLIFSNL